MSVRPLAIDLFCGLGGWTEALLAEGYYVVGFDIERHQYGEHRYQGELVLQDVLTLHGSQFREAALIVASPPCQAYSYRAMPWKRAKALPPPDNTLFEVCFRIQREACEAAGQHIPLIVENVRGAQKWVGRARWNYGSFYLWGDVPALMPFTKSAVKVGGGFSFERGSPYWQSDQGIKVGGIDWSKGDSFNGTSEARLHYGGYERHHPNALGWKSSGLSSTSPRRKAASAMIAKIPFPLARHIAVTFRATANTASLQSKDAVTDEIKCCNAN